MSLLALAATALGLGFLHGLGADHLMAIAALTVNGQTGRTHGRVVETAVGFALGHTMALGLGAVAAALFGLMLPAAVEAGAERVGGALLVVLGVTAFWGVVSGRAFGHVHRQTDGRSRWHIHVGSTRHPHGHSRVPTIMGAVFAVSSLRALMLLQPFGVSAASLALPSLLLLILLFGIGILSSMSLFGVVLARALSLAAVEAAGRAAAVLVAFASIGLGLYWMAWR
jgi:hypothetical protein